MFSEGQKSQFVGDQQTHRGYKYSHGLNAKFSIAVSIEQLLKHGPSHSVYSSDIVAARARLVNPSVL